MFSEDDRLWSQWLSLLPSCICWIQLNVIADVQVLDAHISALWRQGLDLVLPAAPILYIIVCQCTIEAGVCPEGDQQ